MFKIDEENWADLDGEILVTMASPLAALVDEGDEVTVSGTLRPFVRADFERDWRFFDVSPALELQLTRKPVMVAATLVNSDDKEMLAVTFPPISRGTADSASGASRTGGQLMMGTAGQTGGLRGEKDSVTDMNTLAKATDTRLVGRRATLTEVRVAALDENGGFWAATLAGDRLYVLPAAGEFSPTVGSTVSIDGYVLRMPRQMQRRLEERQNTGDEEIYLYAHRIT